MDLALDGARPAGLFFFHFSCRAADFRINVVRRHHRPPVELATSLGFASRHSACAAVCDLYEVALFLCETFPQPDFILLDLPLRFGFATLAVVAREALAVVIVGVPHTHCVFLLCLCFTSSI